MILTNPLPRRPKANTGGKAVQPRLVVEFPGPSSNGTEPIERMAQRTMRGTWASVVWLKNPWTERLYLTCHCRFCAPRFCPAPRLPRACSTIAPLLQGFVCNVRNRNMNRILSVRQKLHVTYIHSMDFVYEFSKHLKAPQSCLLNPRCTAPSWRWSASR